MEKGQTSCFHRGTNSPVSLDFSSGGRGVPIWWIVSVGCERKEGGKG